ncbi:copper chaperone PCu(A)C [Streptacidiphilus cavernicola]|uniref:Copper chaperone PCu(A)C n=1 Tax=Streptacidiphilus cavernicola TaxID=3342716 RepID=A0ABV6W0M0_9ACTN
MDPDRQQAEEERELLALEQEAAALEARNRRRGGLPRLRRLLMVQAPVLVALAVVLLLWGRNAPEQAAAAAPSPALIGMTDAHLDPPASSGGPVYAYVTIRNNGGTPDRLVGASSPWAKTISVVSGSSNAGVPWITVPAHGSVTLKAGADRLALSDLNRVPKVGDTIQLDLNFASSGTVYVFAPVGPASSLTVLDVMNAMKHMDRLPPQ